MRLSSWVGALCVLAAPVHAAPLGPPNIDDIARLSDQVLSELSVSRGRVMGTLQSSTGEFDLVRFEEGAPHRLFRARVASVSPDGHWMLYLSDQVWVLRDQQTGVERRSALPKTPEIILSAPVWSADSRFVAAHYTFAKTAPESPATPTLSGGVKVEVIDGSERAIHTRASASFDPNLLIWDASAPQPQIAKLDATGTYAGDWLVGGPELHTYYYAMGQQPYAGQTPVTLVQALQAETGVTRSVVRLKCFNQSLRPRLSPNGRYLAFAADLDAKAFGVANNVVLADVRTGAFRALTHDLAVSAVFWGEDGLVYFLRRNGGFQELESIDLQGRRRLLTHGDQYRAAAAQSPDKDQIVYTTVDGYGRKELRSWSVVEGRERTLAVVADPGASYRLGRFRQVRWRAPDGLTLKGFIVVPADYDPKRRYPLLVDVHGGGPGSRLYLWSVLGYRSQSPLEWHLWASLGYVVFVPDYRSSGEYGAAINKARARKGERDGDVGGILQDARDVESGVRWLLGGGGIDARRIAIFGQSAGGARVNYLLTRSRIFVAGIIHDPIEAGPLAEDLRQARLALPITWYGAKPSPAQRRAQLTGFLFDGWRSITPTLIMVGNPERGALDPLSAETLYAMLQSAHVPTRFVRFLEDGHSVSSPGGILARFAEMKSWLDLYAPAERGPKLRPRGLAAPAELSIRPSWSGQRR